MKLLDEYNTKSLSKILYETNIMPSGNSQSFVKLSEKLILKLQNGYKIDKIKRVLSSELITTFGLSINENEVEEMAELIKSWYEN